MESKKMAIRIAIYGYGNLGKGVEAAISHNPDMSLEYVFTRREPASLKLATSAKAVKADDVALYKDKVDVMIICSGSATDLPEHTPRLAKDFNVIDSFDTHAQIPTHFEKVDAAAKEGGRLALISCGWDPGMFSLNRVIADAILPGGNTYTFWGKGVSQGHSDAIRRIEGVVDARQYTVPVEDALEKVRAGKDPVLTTREKHTRLCYVVAEEGADKALIEKQIKTMPNYFDQYDTTVNFISLEELKRDHGALPHGGSVIHSARTGLENENNHVVEYSLKLDSNPQFTSSILVAYARAVYRMSKEGRVGCISVLDVPPAMLSQKTSKELLAHML